MTKKMLMITSVASMIKQFNMDNITILQHLGYQVYVATNFKHGSTMSTVENRKLQDELDKLGVVTYQVDFQRGIGTPRQMIHVLKQLSQIVKNDDFYFIHCHSTIGGICGRLIGHRYHVKVIYTAHGFQFFKGSSIKSWLLIYPIEKYLSRYTDNLITINEEDFELAKSKLHPAHVEYVPGIGVDVTKIARIQTEKAQMRKELGVPEQALFILSVGELSDRKNHAVVLDALSSISNRNIFYVICGIGENKTALLNLAKDYGLENNFKLLGYRTDIIKIMKSADLFVFPSLLEGLPVSLMEAMAAGVPVMASAIRGNTDLINQENDGFLFDPKQSIDLKNKINKYLLLNKNQIEQLRINNKEKIKHFDKKIVSEYMTRIYRKI